MVKPLNKEWQLFGQKYRVAGAKGAKVDCRACNKPVSAAVNRLQSHMRICPARSLTTTSLLSSNSKSESSNSGHSESIFTTSELIEQAIEAGPLAVEQAAETNANTAESNTPPAKKQRKTTTKTRDRPRWSASATSSMSVDEVWINSAVTGPTAGQTASLDKKRLEIEEKRLQLEVARDQREERREQLNLEILQAQARREKLLADKEGYEAKVVLALSRKQLRDEGVSEEEINRILPISSSQSNTRSSASTMQANDAASD